MRAPRSFTWLMHVALSLVCTSAASDLFAQTPQPAQAKLEATLSPGMTVWITDSAGREEKTQIVEVSADGVTTAAGAGVRRFRTSDVTRVRARHSDPVINGALIGAGAALGSGLLLCRLTEPWQNCRDDFGPMALGGIGAGVGIGVDLLIRGRRTIYEAPNASTGLRAAPLVTRRGGGVQIALLF